MFHAVLVSLALCCSLPTSALFHLPVAHTKETEVDHMRFNASYKAMQVR
jgi:hypothetical protein